MTNENKQLLKFVIIGDDGVGKSSLLTRFTEDNFSDSYISTIGVDFRSRQIEINGDSVRLQIWDTSGQERFKSVTTAYYRSAYAIIVVFDVTNTKSFDNINKWMQEIDQYGNNDTKKLLVGNKSDLTDQRIVEYEKAKELADSLRISYVETSAKNSTNVEQAFRLMVTNDMSNILPMPAKPLIVNDKSVIKPVENPILSGSDYDETFKLLLIGDSGVGKSSLLIRFTDDIFSDSYLSTIGIDFRIRVIKHDAKTIKLQIWDTAGQERFRNVISSYYRDANGIIIVFDVTSTESFDSIRRWLEEIKRCGNSDAKKLIVGNKSDLQTKRMIEYHKAKELADSLGIPYVETSAKDSTNVEQAFKAVVSEIIPDKTISRINEYKYKIGSQNKLMKNSSGFC